MPASLPIDRQKDKIKGLGDEQLRCRNNLPHIPAFARIGQLGEVAIYSITGPPCDQPAHFTGEIDKEAEGRAGRKRGREAKGDEGTKTEKEKGASIRRSRIDCAADAT